MNIKRLLPLVLCVSLVLGCSTQKGSQSTNTPGDLGAITPKKPQDLFEPLREPYLRAFHSARLGDKYQTKTHIQQMLQVLERLRTYPSESWPSPYRGEVQLTQKAIELLVNQVKVVGVLNITGQHQEAYATLLDAGYVLKRVRRHLGIVRPTDHMLGIYRALEQIKTNLDATTMDWAAQQAQVDIIQSHRQALGQLPRSDWPKRCLANDRWHWIIALEKIVKQNNRELLTEQWQLARRQFYSTFQTCG